MEPAEIGYVAAACPPTIIRIMSLAFDVENDDDVAVVPEENVPCVVAVVSIGDEVEAPLIAMTFIVQNEDAPEIVAFTVSEDNRVLVVPTNVQRHCAELVGQLSTVTGVVAPEVQVIAEDASLMVMGAEEHDATLLAVVQATITSCAFWVLIAGDVMLFATDTTSDSTCPSMLKEVGVQHVITSS